MTLLRYIRMFIVKLGADFPGTYKDVLMLTGTRVWRIGVGPERAILRVTKGVLVASADDGQRANAQCTITLKALGELVHGELSVLSALATEQLVLKGDLDSLLRFSEFLHVMFDSTPRSRGLETLASRFLRGHRIARKGGAPSGRKRRRVPPKTYRFGLNSVLDNNRMERHHA